MNFDCLVHLVGWERRKTELGINMIWKATIELDRVHRKGLPICVEKKRERKREVLNMMKKCETKKNGHGDSFNIILVFIK